MSATPCTPLAATTPVTGAVTVEDAPPSPRAPLTPANIRQRLMRDISILRGTFVYGDTDSCMFIVPSVQEDTPVEEVIPAPADASEEEDGSSADDTSDVEDATGGAANESDEDEDGDEDSDDDVGGAESECDEDSDDDVGGAESESDEDSDDDTASERSCCDTASDIADIQPYGLHPFAAEMPETTTITQRVQQYYEPPCESAGHRYRTFLRAVDLHMLMADIEHDIKGRVRDAQRRKALPIVRIRLCHPAQLLRTIHYYSSGVRMTRNELGLLLARYNRERRGRATPRLHLTNLAKPVILAEFGAPLLAEQDEW